MIRAQVVTTWKGTGTRGDPKRPAVGDDHPALTWSDVTGTPAGALPPSPNAVIVEGVWDPTVFQALLDDPNYGQGSVLWQENQ